ncbi:MAG: hypothetical protein U1E18_00650 [Brevundimonas sp.]|uniref:hypothetical protein n=1 Tax=Brevundimonas sp. TaxID=1871086 RepID=UPI002ABB5276|nr:hypothetical protein [Brevundimonas sp.]MDZ4108094.1 hypothetical protein [Brevundimonas sp.]
MRTIHTLFAASLAAGVALAATSPAAAIDQRKASEARQTSRAVLICDTDAATRRAFTREHGAAPVFVTAEEALRVRPSDPAWTTPRCITEREHARLRDATTAQARVP